MVLRTAGGFAAQGTASRAECKQCGQAAAAEGGNALQRHEQRGEEFLPDSDTKRVGRSGGCGSPRLYGQCGGADDLCQKSTGAGLHGTDAGAGE